MKSAYTFASTAQASQKLAGCAARPAFQNSDRPPEYAQDITEATSIFLEDPQQAWEYGNRLLKFLMDTITAYIKKVNRTKFTVKAQVIWEDLMCEIKVRAYQIPENRVVFVFQRLGGDSLAFNSLFQCVKKLLLEGDTEQPAPVSLPAPSVSQKDPQSDLQSDMQADLLTPVIDAAHRAEDTQAQAEAAATMAAATDPKDTGSVQRLCRDDAKSAIQKLLEANCFEVSCQVVRLLVKLAMSPGAEALFQCQGIMEKVWHLGTKSMWNFQRNGETRLRDQLMQVIERSSGNKLGRKGSALSDCAEVNSYVNHTGVFYEEAPHISAGRR
ncbi:unnamed protein product [Symbiodinium sp. CCMP2456]|nr:unnamed protein product [Symbiodinium sp. CCMP2456]